MEAAQVRAARGLLRWSQADLSDKSGVSVPTIKRLEAMEGELVGHATTIKAIATAFETAGVVFISEGEMVEGGAGVRRGK